MNVHPFHPQLGVQETEHPYLLTQDAPVSKQAALPPTSWERALADSSLAIGSSQSLSLAFTFLQEEVKQSQVNTSPRFHQQINQHIHQLSRQLSQQIDQLSQQLQEQNLDKERDLYYSDFPSFIMQYGIEQALKVVEVDLKSALDKWVEKVKGSSLSFCDKQNRITYQPFKEFFSEVSDVLSQNIDRSLKLNDDLNSIYFMSSTSAQDDLKEDLKPIADKLDFIRKIYDQCPQKIEENGYAYIRYCSNSCYLYTYLDEPNQVFLYACEGVKFIKMKSQNLPLSQHLRDLQSQFEQGAAGRYEECKIRRKMELALQPDISEEIFEKLLRQ